MKRERWFDCNGAEIFEGDVVRDLDSGKEEQVYVCHPEGRPDQESLGVNATNEEWMKYHPDWPREVYPFSNFAYKTVNGEHHLAFYEKVV